MLEGIGDHLKKKAQELGLDRADRLKDIQDYLDKLYPGQCRVVSLNKGVLKVTTPSASVASELRYSHQLKIQIGKDIKLLVVIST